MLLHMDGRMMAKRGRKAKLLLFDIASKTRGKQARTPMLILNLGCGVRVSDDPAVVNIDWSPYLRIARNPFGRRLGPLFLDRERTERLRQMPTNIALHNLRKGIPWPDGSVDVVYHSHLLEHLDRSAAPLFQREVWRVLRPGGVQRIVVPDLETLCRRIVDDLDSKGDQRRHDGLVADLLEQCTRREAFGTKDKSWLRRRVENIVLGDARRRGESHQWMYDRVNLATLLEEAGFREISVSSHDRSRISTWSGLGLDELPDGSPYKADSLYVEAVVPSGGSSGH